MGCAIKDMPPWADPENPDVTNMVNIKLTGNGNDDLRECTGLIDDNGDSQVDTNDGLFVTCVSVTDDWGNTVMYIISILDTAGGSITGTAAGSPPARSRRMWKTAAWVPAFT